MSVIKLLTVKEVAEITGLSRATIYRWSLAGKFPSSKKVGNHLARWVSTDIEKWMADLEDNYDNKDVSGNAG